jgi:pimeloyl-ACP methyl ester carboxylesterase
LAGAQISTRISQLIGNLFMIKLVLLPGMDGSGTLFEAFIAALGPGFDVTALRYPAAEPLDYAGLVALARAALPVDGTYVLLGESFSGPIAISLAAARPPGLAGLVLSCAFAKNPQPWLGPARELLPLIPLDRLPLPLLLRVPLGRFDNETLRAALVRALDGVCTETLRVRIRAASEVDVSDDLKRVSMPLLYLRASDDLLVPASASEWIAACAPQTQIVELPAPHFLLQAAPEAAAQVVSTFAQNVNTCSSD